MCDNTKPNTLTPTTLMVIFANAFKMEEADRVFQIKGVYEDRYGRNYDGYCYDRLKDENGEQAVTLKIPEHIKSTISNGGSYLFKGVLDKDLRPFGAIELVFVVTELVGQVEGLLENKIEQRIAVQKQKADMGYRDLDQLLRRKLSQGQKPRIGLICGSTSIVMQDVLSALKDAKNRYDLVEHRINLSSRETIIDALNQNDNNKYDALAVVRGGGSGLDIFDDVEIAKTSLSLNPILVTAIGHAKDVTLLQQVADKRFTTPTALGTYLKEMARDTQKYSSQQRVASQVSEPVQSRENNIPCSMALVLLFIISLLGVVLSGFI